jgi:hypothetical protein
VDDRETLQKIERTWTAYSMLHELLAYDFNCVIIIEGRNWERVATWKASMGLVTLKTKRCWLMKEIA